MLRNITLSAEEALIEQARERYDALMAQLEDVQAGRSFSRDELNERQIFP